MVVCESKSTLPQFSGTCWFNAFITVIFHSDGMRNYMLKAIPKSMKKTKSKKKLEILEMCLQIAKISITANEKDFEIFYNELRPENILSTLHSKNKTKFFHDPAKAKGGIAEYYLFVFFDYLGISDRVLFTYQEFGEFYVARPSLYSIKAKLKKKTSIQGHKYEYEIEYTKRKAPVSYNKIDIIIGSDSLSGIFTPSKKNIIIPDLKIDTKTLDVQIKKNKYTVDGLLLNNFNTDTCDLRHTIAGITCKNKRYMYNGWMLKKKMKSCDFFRIDWVKGRKSFCFSRSLCSVKNSTKNNIKDLCFKTDKKRIYIWVKDDKKVVTKPVKDDKKIVTKLVKKPKNNENNNIPISKLLKPVKKPSPKKKENIMNKPCPEGKVRHKETKRCRKIK